MEFIAYYQNISEKTEKRELRNKIIDACKIQHSTYYSWLHRKTIPLLAQEKIAEIIGKPVEELFPEKENELVTI